MTITAGTLINDALTELGVLAEGDTPTAEMSASALRVLNRMLDGMSTNQSFAYFANLITRTLTGESSFYIGPAIVLPFSVNLATPATFTCTNHGLSIGDTVTLTTTGALPTGLSTGTTYYVITAGFTANSFELALTSEGTPINTSVSQSGVHTFTQTSSLTKTISQRPIGIESAYLDRSGIHYPVRVIDNQLFDSIIYPAASGANTVYVYYEAQVPNGIIHCWPLASGCTLGLRVINQVVNFTDLTTPTTLPPGYDDCIVNNLAVRLSPLYPAVTLSPITARLAKTSFDLIQRRNNVIPTMSIPTAVTANKGGFSLANFLSGN